MRSVTPKRAAMVATVTPACASFANATTWSAGCIAMRMTFSASESSPAIAVRGDLAGHRMIGVESAVLGKGLQGREAAPAGDDGEAFGAVGIRDRRRGRRGSPADRAP